MGPAVRGGARRTLDTLLALAPVVWLLTRDPYTPGRRLAACAQNRLGRPADNLAFEIEGDRVVWRRAMRQVDADDLVAAQGVDRHERQQAGAWLLNLLQEGPIEADQLWEEARICRLAERTVRRAAAELGLRPIKQGQGGPWRWGWNKAGEQPGPDGRENPVPSVAAFEPVGSLPNSAVVAVEMRRDAAPSVECAAA